MRLAFDADKDAMQERIRLLEQSLKDKEQAQSEVQRRVANMEQNDQVQRSELNFWDGKVTKMRRDLDFQQQFNANLAIENRKLMEDMDNLKKHLQMKDKEQSLFVRQIQGL